MGIFGSSSVTVEGQRLDDLNVTVSTYGDPIPIIFGPENRVGGNVIWSTGLIETESRETQKQGKGGGVKTTTVNYTYSLSVAVAIGKGPITGIGRIWGDSKIIADFRDQLSTMGDPNYSWPFVSGLIDTSNDGIGADTTPTRYDTITIYNGNETQLPNSIIEANEEEGQIPAYRGIAYVVFDNLDLSDFGNRLPNLTFEVVADWSITSGEIITEICDKVGLTTSDFNSRSMTDNVRGLVLQKEKTARNIIRPLLQIYETDLSEINGVLHFIPKDRTPIFMVPSDRLGASNTKKPPAHQRQITLEEEANLPRTYEITHLDPERDYQANTQTAERRVKSTSRKTTIGTDVVMTADVARFTAENKLKRAWTTRKQFDFTMPPMYSEAVAGDTIVIQDIDFNEFSVRCEEITNEFGFLKGRGRAQYFEFNFIHQGQSVPTREIVSVRAVFVTGLLMDIPPLRDQDNDSGIYIAAGSESNEWRGATLTMSSDGGLVYNSALSIGGNAVTGQTVNQLQPSPVHYTDNISYLDIVLDNSEFTLTSTNDTGLLNGENSLFINGEVLQFRDASPLGNSTYRVSHLLRGRVGTEDKVVAHSIASPIVLLTGGAIERLAMPISTLGAERGYKFVPTGVDSSSISGVSATYEARSLRCFSPTHLKSELQPNGDVELSWIRRTRMGGFWKDNNDVALSEVSELYDLEILNDSGQTVLRTISRLSNPSYTYTAAEQTSDFNSAKAHPLIRVYQISDVTGRGIPAQGVV